MQRLPTSHETLNVIALWVHPRSMSTATERLMRARGDLSCFHEPFIYYYYVEQEQRALAEFCIDPERPTSFPAICDQLRLASNDGTVFFKDMAYYVVPWDESEMGFLDAISHAFLIRDPRRALTSFYAIDPDFALDELGYMAQLELLTLIEKRQGKPVPVIEAEVLQADPPGTMNELWSRLDLPPCDSAFQWDANDAVPAAWKAVSGWHQSVIHSRGIRPPSQADSEEALQEKLDSVFRESPRMRDILDAHMPAYNALRARSLRFSSTD